jgi:phospholipid-binding lipoprotein MlaA
VKQGVGNFFSNLTQPRVAVNDLLQGKFAQSGSDIGRFLMNSTVGILGFIDVAKSVGLEPNEEDWGQTFAAWGMHDGPYFVWPIIGPRYARDTLGFGFDFLSNPVTYVEPPAASWGLWGVDIVDIRARLLPSDAVIEQAAGEDKYAASAGAISSTMATRPSRPSSMTNRRTHQRSRPRPANPRRAPSSRPEAVPAKNAG